jgi:hypothetical protein
MADPKFLHFCAGIINAENEEYVRNKLCGQWAAQMHEKYPENAKVELHPTPFWSQRMAIKLIVPGHKDTIFYVTSQSPTTVW